MWWGWHDGVGAGKPRELGGPWFVFLTLADAVDQYRTSRDLAVTAALTPDETDRLWHPSWFPITVTGYGAVIACDCSVPDDSPTPIRVVDWGHNERSDVPAAQSFGQMVEWWIEALESGAWRYDQTLGRWVIDHDRLEDPHLGLTRLV